MGEGADAPQETRTQLSTTGILAFVLGLLSCFSCGLGVIPGVPALILGSNVLFRSRKPPVHLVDTGLALGGMLLACFGIAVCFGWVPKTWLPPDPQGPSCQNNLKEIGAALKMYAGEHGGTFPDKLSVLYPDYCSDPGIFVCPQSKNKPGDPARFDAWSDYTYVPGLHPTGAPTDADVVVCTENEYCHHDARNELYLDGHAETHKIGKPHESLKPAHP